MEKNKKFIRNAKKEDCAVVRGKLPIIMEVVGPNGIKLHEYIDKGDDSLPYYELNERVTV